MRFCKPSSRFRLEHSKLDFLGAHEEDKPSQTFGAHTSPDGIEAQIQQVLAALDVIQRWPDNLAEVPLYQVVRTPGSFGGFHHENGVARGITINQAGPHPRLTTAHEVGHRFDFDVVGQSGTFESERAEDLGSVLHGWWLAVRGSDRFSELSDTVSDPFFGDDAREFLKKRELFARSYAQYVAHKSESTELLEELREVQDAYGMESLRQWSDGDFTSIERAFDRLLEELEMMP